MSTISITGTTGDDKLGFDPRRLTDPVVIDGLAGADELRLPAIHDGRAGRPVYPVRIDLAQGALYLPASDGSGWQRADVTLRDIEALYGGKGWDAELIGDAGSNRLETYGTGSAHVLVGGAGNDTLIGGTADYSLTAGPVQASLTTHAATSVDGVDRVEVRNLIGSAFNDLLVGDSEINTLEGGGGNDTLVGGPRDTEHRPGPGDDSIVGGSGFDVLSFADATAGVTVRMSEGPAVGLQSGTDRFS